MNDLNLQQYESLNKCDYIQLSLFTELSYTLFCGVSIMPLGHIGMALKFTMINTSNQNDKCMVGYAINFFSLRMKDKRQFQKNTPYCYLLNQLFTTAEAFVILFSAIM